MTLPVLPKLKKLPGALPMDGAVRIELERGIPIFRVSSAVQSRIEDLLFNQWESGKSARSGRRTRAR